MLCQTNTGFEVPKAIETSYFKGLETELNDWEVVHEWPLKMYLPLWRRLRHVPGLERGGAQPAIPHRADHSGVRQL